MGYRIVVHSLPADPGLGARNIIAEALRKVRTDLLILGFQPDEVDGVLRTLEENADSLFHEMAHGKPK